MGKKILFIHHSTGGNLIREGEVREEIKKLNPNVEFWDHNYNLFPVLTSLLANHTHLRGLTDNNGNITGKDYNITLSNNSPKEYAEIFARSSDDPTLKEILSYDVIAFKNCYPTTRIASDEQLEEDMKYYKVIRNSIKKYPDKQFVLVTPPPARKETTSGENGKRAITLFNWLNSSDFQQQTPNLHVFDFFSLLADERGFLRQEYERTLPWDSHPNKKANKAVAPLFAKYLLEQVK
jgi:hypothetical protein